MAQAYVSSEGVVTIPEAIRVALGIEQGGRVEFLQLVEGQVTMVALNLSTKALEGVLPRPEIDCEVGEMIERATRRAAMDVK